MRNLVHKICGVLVAAILPAAAGCTAYSVRYDRSGGNPPFGRGDHDYPSDGAQAGDVFRICFDRHGELYEDPADPASDLPARANAQCRGGRPLLVLIHGCNNTYPEARRSYYLAQLVVRDQLPVLRPVFLEVY